MSKTRMTLKLCVMMAVELEKSERLKRQRSVIITGLAPEAGTSDADLLPLSERTVRPRHMCPVIVLDQRALKGTKHRC